MIIQGLDVAWNVLLAIAGLDGAVEGDTDRLAIDPVQLGGDETVRLEAWMVMALRHDRDIACHIFIHHVPGVVAGLFEAADAQPFALAQGMVHQALVFPDQLPIDGFNPCCTGLPIKGQTQDR